MTELPTKEELKNLSKKALVAYAVRNALRVQPLFQENAAKEDFQKPAGWINASITLAQLWANGENIPPEDLKKIKNLVYQTTDATAYFAAATANASTHAAAYAYAFEAAQSAGTALGEESHLITSASISDFQKLLDLNLSESDSIDASETGTLGPLWPNGKPMRYLELKAEN